MAPRCVFGPLSPTQGPKSAKKWLFYHKSESGVESESDIRENSFAASSHMDLGEGLSKESFNHNQQSIYISPEPFPIFQ